MKNKILLGSVTLLSALMVAACGNGEKKATETTAAPTTEATTTTAAPTTTAPTTTASASSEAKEVSLEDTQRIGREDTGYVNVPKDWVEFKSANGGPQYQYAALDGYNIVTLNVYTKDKYQPVEGETWGAEMVANRLYGTYQKNPSIEKIQGAKRKVVGMDAFLVQILTKDGKYFFTWVFQKDDKVYSTSFEGNKETLLKMFDLIEQTWGLDPKTPGK